MVSGAAMRGTRRSGARRGADGGRGVVRPAPELGDQHGGDDEGAAQGEPAARRLGAEGDGEGGGEDRLEGEDHPRLDRREVALAVELGDEGGGGGEDGEDEEG